MIISINSEKAFDKNIIHDKTKNSIKIGFEVIFPKIIMAIYNKLVLFLIVKLRAFLLR